MTGPADLPVEPFKDAAAFEKWLERNASAAGLWLKIAKKDSGIASVTYAEALDVALCHGWIDGLKKGLDDQFFLQRFAPRKKRSLWSKNNIAHVERLIAAGRMREGGLREIEAAKADGRWDAAYDGAAKMAVPPELAAVLAKNRKAKAFFRSARQGQPLRVLLARAERGEDRDEAGAGREAGGDAGARGKDPRLNPCRKRRTGQSRAPISMSPKLSARACPCVAAPVRGCG